MSLLYSIPMTELAFDAGLTLGANGTTVSSASAPNGIAGRIVPGDRAPDGSLATRSRITGSDAEVFGGIRSEMSCDQGAGLVGAAAERLYVWQMFIPQDFSIATPFLSCFQIHDDPDVADDVKYPNIITAIDNTWLTVYLPLSAPTENTARRVAGSARLVRGRWAQCALHVFWSPTASGFMEYAYDKTVVMRQWFAPSHFVDVLRPYPKWGLYDSLKIPGTIDDHSVFYRDMRIYDGKTDLAMIDGARFSPMPVALG